MPRQFEDRWPDVAGALIAGGRSVRFGTDKALLEFAGDPLWRRGQKALAALFSRVLIAGDRPDLASEDCPCYPDIQSAGALGGLATALACAGRDWVCVLPCDLPYPSPRLLATLLQYRQGVLAVVPRTSGGREPLIACYHRDSLPVIRRQMATGNLRVTDLLDLLPCRYVNEAELPPGWRRSVRNLNSQGDLAALRKVPPAVTVVARSGTGKTTLLVKLIGELTCRGWTLGALKHDAHSFDIDREGKDSWRLTQAGAVMTVISSPDQYAQICRHEIEPSLEFLLGGFTGADLVLTEGFKYSSLPKVEIQRGEMRAPLLCRGDRHDPTLIAVVSDVQQSLDVPLFGLEEISFLADFLEERFL